MWSNEVGGVKAGWICGGYFPAPQELFLSGRKDHKTTLLLEVNT